MYLCAQGAELGKSDPRGRISGLSLRRMEASEKRLSQAHAYVVERPHPPPSLLGRASVDQARHCGVV